jgi:hypothetical protein
MVPFMVNAVVFLNLNRKKFFSKVKSNGIAM